MNDKLHELVCNDCVHCHICKYREEYEAFLDGPAKDVFDIMPDFLEMQVNCEYRKIKRPFTERSIQYLNFK